MKSGQVAQGFDQFGLEYLQDLRSHNLSGPLLHCSAVSMMKSFLLVSSLNLSCINAPLLSVVAPPRPTVKILTQVVG